MGALPQTPVIGSRSRARHARGSSPPNMILWPHPWLLVHPAHYINPCTHSITHPPTVSHSGVYQSSSMSPQKCPFATGIWALSNTWLIRTPGVYNKTASWLVQPFMQGSPVCPTKANRQTRLTDRQTTKNLLTFLQALSVSVALSHI